MKETEYRAVIKYGCFLNSWIGLKKKADKAKTKLGKRKLKEISEFLCISAKKASAIEREIS